MTDTLAEIAPVTGTAPPSIHRRKALAGDSVASPETAKPTKDPHPSQGFLGTIFDCTLSFLLSFLRYLALLAIVAFIFRQSLPPLLSLPSSIFCIIPGLCNSNPRVPMWADFPKLGRLQSNAIDSLIGSGLGSYELVGFVTKAEMAASDLVSAVRLSDLKSRDHLAYMLDEFAHDAAQTGDDLQGLHAQIMGTADNIFTINEWALRSIEGAVSEDNKQPAVSPRRSLAEVAVFESFAEVMRVQSSELEDLVERSMNILGQLKSLKQTLKTIHGIVYRENKQFTEDEEKLLSTLWAQLGGYVQDKAKFKRNLLLLDRLGDYHNEAVRQVQQALLVLNRMREEMKVLRKNVAAPAIGSPNIPPHLHMKSIQSAMDRLQQSMRMAKGKVTQQISSVGSGQGR